MPEFNKNSLNIIKSASSSLLFFFFPHLFYFLNFKNLKYFAGRKGCCTILWGVFCLFVLICGFILGCGFGFFICFFVFLI